MPRPPQSKRPGTPWSFEKAKREGASRMTFDDDPPQFPLTPRQEKARDQRGKFTKDGKEKGTK